jgi:hypothetical protein
MTSPPAQRQDSAQQSWAPVLVAWLLVSVPLLWGVWQTIKKAAVLFR